MPSMKSAFRKLTGARRRRQPAYASDEEYEYDCARVGFEPEDGRGTLHDGDYYALEEMAEGTCRDARMPGAFPDEEDESEDEGEDGDGDGDGEMEYQQQQDTDYQHQQPRNFQHHQAPSYQPQPTHYQHQRTGPQVLHYQNQRQERVHMFATSSPLDDEYELGYGDVSPYIVAEEKEEQKGMNMAGAWVD